MPTGPLLLDQSLRQHFINELLQSGDAPFDLWLPANGGWAMRPTITLAAALAIGMTNGAMAQLPDWAIGTWKGTLRGNGVHVLGGNSGAVRVLTIGPDGKCIWSVEVTGFVASPARCTFSGNSVSVLNAASNKFDFVYNGGKLDGFFEHAQGLRLLITMNKQTN
jgi:hypothetical protein